MKEKEIIIGEIESMISDFENFFIGFMGYPQSLAILHEKGLEIEYGENCISENDARFIVNYFQVKGMNLDKIFSKNIARGIFIRGKE